eukprot:SAG31_NODE_3991_length_3680_cov_3.034627_2_plen_61_part_00
MAVFHKNVFDHGVSIQFPGPSARQFVLCIVGNTQRMCSFDVSTNACTIVYESIRKQGNFN